MQLFIKIGVNLRAHYFSMSVDKAKNFTREVAFMCLFGIGEGKIEMSLSKTDFAPGETVRGRLKLHLKKAQKARELRIEFFGEECCMGSAVPLPVITRRVKKQLDGERIYHDGETFDFSFKIPPGILSQQHTGILPAFDRIWMVQASLNLPLKLDVTERMTVRLRRQERGKAWK